MGCYCASVSPITTRTRVVVLQHPREYGNAIGTARIAQLCLPSSEVFVGVEFADQPRLNALLSDPERPAIVLYPGKDARDLHREPPPGPVTLVLIDGTWNQARSLMSRNPLLAQLPRYAFEPPRPSEYQIRREPRADYVSTIEALSFALEALEGEPGRFDSLLSPFRKMVSVQVEFASRSTHGRHRKRRRLPGPVRARLPALLLSPSLLCVSGEANAWPHDRTLRRPPYPHELVHWLAVRPGDEPRFEVLIKPRTPLSKSPAAHARLSNDALLAGCSLEELLTRWHAFVRPDDVLCCWGHYACELLRREGGRLPTQVVDLRKVAGDFLKSRPGSLEELVEAHSLASTPRGEGRGGERLGMLEAVTRWLADEARCEQQQLATAQPMLDTAI